MNYNTKEMIKLYSLCTGNTDKYDIINTLSKSPIFNEIKNGTNNCLNYEGYISNLLEIVADLKTNSDYPKEIDNVKPEVIAAVKRTEQREALQRRCFREHIFSYDFFNIALWQNKWKEM